MTSSHRTTDKRASGLARLRRAVWPAEARTRRLTQLLVGLALYGFSDGMLVLANLGLDPWDVLHQGLSRRIGGAVGTWSIIVGALVLLLWLPLRQWPGLGTVCNVFTVGTAVNLTLRWVPAPHGLVAQAIVMAAAVALNGVATGCYIGAGLGPGPRDGLMTGLAARGHSLRVMRTGVELTVLAVGWLLGGSVGVGTVVYALGIGPIAHQCIPRLTVRTTARPTSEQPGSVGACTTSLS